MAELKPCPFCGGAATTRKVASGNGPGGFTATYEVGCDACKIKFRGESKFDVVNGEPVIIRNGYLDCCAQWNRRAEDA